MATCGALFMAQYRVVGNLTYATTANRNTALTAINSVVAAYNVVNTGTGAITGGVNTSGTTALTISLVCPTETIAEQFRISLLSAWTAAPRTAGFVAITREP